MDWFKGHPYVTSQIPVKIFQTNQSAFQSDGLILLQPMILDLLGPKKLNTYSTYSLYPVLVDVPLNKNDHPGSPRHPMVSPILSPLKTHRLLQAVLSIVKRGSSLECLISTGRTCHDEAMMA